MGPQPLKSLAGPSLKEGAAVAVALAPLAALAPRVFSGLYRPPSALTRECPVAEAGRGGRTESRSRGGDPHLLTMLPLGCGEIPPHPPPSGLDRNSPGRQLPRPTCYCGQGAQRGGRGSPNLPHPRLRLLTFLIPHSLPSVGWGDLIAQQEERNKHSWGACCVLGTVLISTSSISFSPSTSLGGRWSHAVHCPGEEAGSERVSHLPGVT